MHDRSANETTPLLETGELSRNSSAHVSIDIDKLIGEFKYQDTLESLSQRLSNVYRRRYNKYIPIAVSGAFCLALAATFIVLMKKFSEQPSLRPPHGIPPDFAGSYANTTLSGMNSTCGELYPLVDICDFSKYTQMANWVCSDIARNLCGPQNELWAFTNTIYAGANATCAQLYPIRNFCDWHSILGYAHECFWKARSMCQDALSSDNMQDIVKQYLNTTLADAVYCPNIPRLTNVTCGDLLPLTDVCNWRDYTTTIAWRCAEAANNLCSSQSLQLLAQYNATLPDTNYSCQTNYPLADFCNWKSLVAEGYNCSIAAASQCAGRNAWHDPYYNWWGDDDWWSDGRIGFLAVSIIGLLVLLGTAIAISCISSCIKNRRVVSELDEADKTELNKLAGENHLFDIRDDTGIGQALETVASKSEEIVRNKRLISEMRHTIMFAAHPKNRGTPLHDFLNHDGNLDMTRRILWYANLWPEKPRRDEPQKTKEHCIVM